MQRLPLGLLGLLVLAACDVQPARNAQVTPSVVVAAAVPAPTLVATVASPVAQTTPAVATSSVVVPRPPEAMADGMLNLAHLNFLSEETVISGQSVLITHIYSEAPHYEWVDASGEGIAAVDDVARATIVYLDFYAKTKNPRALARARAGLNFTLRLQARDGEFYNFIRDRTGTINTDGSTSYKSLGWWAYRGLWALAHGYGIFRELDPAYAQQLQVAYGKTEQAIAAKLQNVGQMTTVHGFRVPAWLPDGAADATGVMVLALADYQAVAPNPQTKKTLVALADGLQAYQVGSLGTYPWAMHPHTLNAPGFWHAWGAHEAQALARAGEVLKRTDYLDSAKRELDGFYAWQLATERVQEMGVLPFKQGQQAYGTNSLVQAAMNVYRATGDLRYARMGGLHAAWFMGNNMARTPMYDPQTGRGYDGIDRELSINQNSGAESTIEALMALQAVLPVPEAAKYLTYKTTEQRSWRVWEAEDGQPVGGKPNYGHRGWTGEARFSGERFYELRGDDAVDLTIDVPQAGDYLLYAAHLRRAATTTALHLQAVQASAPITIDAKTTEWGAVPPVAANTAQQIVRGAQSWRGAQIDSFTLRTQWDTHNLYVLAEVRDPKWEQTGQGPGVGAGSALWLYLDTEGNGARLGAKITLAQTPVGPQVWDWKAGFLLTNAQLAWTKTADGYIYEAALPWDSLRGRGIQVGKPMRIEVGRNFGGNSFLDLSGNDPDSAANLVPLTLIAQPQLATTATTTGAPATPQGSAGSIALGVQLDGGARWVVPEAVSPDRDYLWLDAVTPQSITVTAGKHLLHLTYAGSDPQKSTVVDGFLLQPAVATKTLQAPNGKQLRLSYDMLKGTLAWDE